MRLLHSFFQPSDHAVHVYSRMSEVHTADQIGQSIADTADSGYFFRRLPGFDSPDDFLYDLVYVFWEHGLFFRISGWFITGSG